MSMKAFLLSTCTPSDAPDGHIASVVPFEGVEHVMRDLTSVERVQFPEPVYFYAYFHLLDTEARDFPPNASQWPLMSARMVETLGAVAAFLHKQRDVILLDDTVLDAHDQALAGSIVSAARRSGYCLIEELPILELIDWDLSEYEIDELEPDEYQFERLVLENPETLPPLFRVRGLEGRLFVSTPGRAAIEQAELAGPVFASPGSIYPGVPRNLHPSSSGEQEQLKPLGFSSDLGHGEDSPPLSRSERPHPEKGEILAYLRSGSRYSHSPGLADDVFEPEHRGIGTHGSLSDGTYLWPEVLAYYVERYDVELPRDFLDHARSHGWRVPNRVT